ncbi:MAG: TatD family hydrolase [Mariprofundaceae bacterium]
MIDSHCHLDDPRIAPHLDTMLARARHAGVDHYIVCGVAPEAWGRLAGLARMHPCIHPAYGIHPWYCRQVGEADLGVLDMYLSDAVALGECGLDFAPGRPDAKLQMQWLRWQIGLAQALRKPLILHCVNACDALLEVVGGADLEGVVHGFGGTPQEARRLLEAGLFIGIGTRLLRADGGLTRRAKALLRFIPPERLLLESDAPDGAPVGCREPNEPSRLPALAAKVAEAIGMTPEALIEIADRNALRLFGLQTNGENIPCRTFTSAPAS